MTKARTLTRLALALAMLAVGCAAPGYWLAPGARPATPGARLAIAPINFRDALPYPLAPRLAIVSRELELFVLSRGAQPLRIAQRSFDALWTQSSQDVGPIVDRSGRRIAGRYEAAMSQLVRTLSERSEHPFEALIVPAVVYREAEVEGLDASWDRISRTLPTVNTPGAEPLPAPTTSSALSLRIEIFSQEGARIFESHAGLEIPERLDLETLHSEPRSDALIDKQHIREALALALGPFLPAPSKAAESAESVASD